MFSRAESQKIDYVLEIYHHCFFFNKVGKVKKKKITVRGNKTTVNVIVMRLLQAVGE